MKILYFDVETTGTSYQENEITQLAGLIEIDGEIVEEFNFDVRPTNFESISQEALEITGKTIDDLKSYPDSYTVYCDFTDILDKYIEKFDKMDKFYPCGYNVDFDIKFLRSFFIRNKNLYLGSYLSYKAIDLLPLMYFLESCEKISLENYKLGTVCAHYDIEIDAHDAMSDINATRQLYLKLKDELTGSKVQI